MKPKQDAFAALRYRDFSIITVNQFCLTLAILIQEIIVAYSLYKITKDPLTLGLIGLAEAIPWNRFCKTNQTQSEWIFGNFIK